MTAEAFLSKDNLLSGIKPHDKATNTNTTLPSRHIKFLDEVAELRKTRRSKVLEGIVDQAMQQWDQMSDRQKRGAAEEFA